MKFIALPVIALSSALASSALGALPAAAAPPTAADCLKSLTHHVAFGSGGTLAMDPAHRTLRVYAYDTDECGKARVSIAISRLDGKDVRNANAVAAGGHSHFIATHAMGWGDTGRWRVRQLAVTLDGKTALKTYSEASTAVVRRAAVLAGDVVPNDETGFTASGTLKAYNSKGALSALPAGRPVRIEVRPIGDASAPYSLVGTTTTTSTGRWSFSTTQQFWKYDVRAVFAQPLETVAPTYKWLGITI